MSTQKYKEFIVQPGEYTAKISKAEWVENQYRETKDNQNGDSLSLWMDLELDDKKYKRVFDTISVIDLLRINEVRISAGLKPFKPSKNLINQDLYDMEGQRVLILVDRYKSKIGKISNIVRSYIEQSDSFDNTTEHGESVPF